MAALVFSETTFKEHVALLLELYRCWDDEDAADAIRNSMDTTWEALSGEARLQIRGLASDLNWVWEGPPPCDITPDNVNQDDLIQLRAIVRTQALGLEELRLLRRCHPRLPPASVAYRRGRIWVAQGYDDLALVFYQHAAQLEPDDPAYTWFALDCLARVDHDAALKQAREALDHPERAPLGVVVPGMMLILASLSEAMPPPAELELLSTAANAAVSRLLSLDAGEPHNAHMLASTCLIGGLCLLLLGRETEAQRLLDVGSKFGAGRNHGLLQYIEAKHPTRQDAAYLLGFVRESMETSLQRAA